MQLNGIPIRCTTFLRDPSTQLTQNGIYDVAQETKDRAIVISSKKAYRYDLYTTK